jgi:hypothetical protein
LNRSALGDSLEIYFIFSKFYCIFYGFFKFIRISGIINEKKQGHSVGPHSGPTSGPQPGPAAQWPGRCGAPDVLARAVTARSAAAVARPARARRRTRRGRGGGTSTVGAATTRLTRWQR